MFQLVIKLTGDGGTVSYDKAEDWKIKESVPNLLQVILPGKRNDVDCYDLRSVAWWRSREL